MYYIDIVPEQLRRLNGGRTFKMLQQQVLADQRNSGYIRIYFDRVPDKQAEQINRASELLQQERYEDALYILKGTREDSRAWNALGVALFMTGSREEGISYIRKAAEQGNRDAQYALDSLNGKSNYFSWIRDLFRFR